MKLAINILVLFIVLYALLLWLIFPIWMIIDCANSPRSGKAKAIWIAMMVISWPLAGLIYGVGVSINRAAQWNGAFGLIMVLGILAVFAVGIPIKIGEVDIKLDTIIQTPALESISAQEKAEVIEALQAIRHDNAALKGYAHLVNSLRMLPLLELFEAYAQDGALSPDEYKDWMALYQTRGRLDPFLLKQQVYRIRPKQHSSLKPQQSG